jgi:hypothetical protein
MPEAAASPLLPDFYTGLKTGLKRINPGNNPGLSIFFIYYLVFGVRLYLCFRAEAFWDCCVKTTVKKLPRAKKFFPDFSSGQKNLKFFLKFFLRIAPSEKNG